MAMELRLPLDDALSPSPQQVLKRLMKDHDTLKKELEHVQEMTSHMYALLGSEESTNMLHEIRKHMEIFMQQLDAYEHWEIKQVLPLLAEYANQEMDITFWTSTWVLEEDHKQAERFVRSFFKYADQCQGTDCTKLRKAISLLSLACSVCTEHLLSEEEMFFPVANQLLLNTAEQGDITWK